jgi:hypothetical protein
LERMGRPALNCQALGGRSSLRSKSLCGVWSDKSNGN